MPGSLSSDSDGPPPKRKRTASSVAPDRAHNPTSQQGDGYVQGPGPVHLPPKRGSRACTNCRRGKNRCEFEGDGPCRRCQLAGIACIFEKPEKKPLNNGSTGIAVERVSHLETQFMAMQSQILSMQSTLDRILNVIQGAPNAPTSNNSDDPQLHQIVSPTVLMPTSSSQTSASINGQHFFPPGNGEVRRPQERHSSAINAPTPQSRQGFPPLPGFAPPPHKFAMYGIVASETASSEDESEDTLPRASLTAPIEALQGLANAAAEAAAASSPRPQFLNPKRVEPIPCNAFPNVIDKGLVSETEARELYKIFFSGCQIFIPLFDPSCDTFDSLKSRTPFCFDSILAVASKIRAGNRPPGETFQRCLEEAQGIARSTLFGPIVRKEAVQAMLLLSAWSTNGWLPSGHAMRMALDLGLHRALEKLAEPSNSSVTGAHGPTTPETGSTTAGKRRSDDEERHLVVSARIWLCLYWFDHQMSLGTGRPIVLRDENSITRCRLLLKHPMASPTDIRLIAQVELIAQKTKIHENLRASLSGQGGIVNSNTLAFVRQANMVLDNWWQEFDALHRQTMDSEALMRKILAGDLHYAKLWLICVVLRGASWDKMSFEQRELAFQAKNAATDVLNTFLGSSAYRAALRYAVHDSLVTAAFAGLFLLKVASLFRREVDFIAIIGQVEQLAQLFSDIAAERYALTLRLMIVNLRRKFGLATGTQTPVHQHADMPDTGPAPPVPDPSSFNGAQPRAPITLHDLDFSLPADMMFSPTSIPTWLHEASLADLSLPANGSDGVFLPVGVSSLWPGDTPSYQAW